MSELVALLREWMPVMAAFGAVYLLVFVVLFVFVLTFIFRIFRSVMRDMKL